MRGGSIKIPPGTWPSLAEGDLGPSPIHWPSAPCPLQAALDLVLGQGAEKCGVHIETAGASG